jgi:hypothetical protein
MYYSYIEIEYVATSFSPARTDLAFKLLTDCIEFHKLTVFTVDAAERLRYYLMCSVKKPVRWTIRMHISRMEVLNMYVEIIPTIKNSPLAVATTEMGNVPFTEATHASIILSHLPVAWRNQYDLTHKTVPELPCATLQNLENIEKLFIEKYNEKAQANKAKAAMLGFVRLRSISQVAMYKIASSDVRNRK